MNESYTDLQKDFMLNTEYRIFLCSVVLTG